MKVETYLFGAVDVDESKVITFPNGLAGFENSNRFILAHESDKGRPTSFTLQSLEDPTLALQIADPATLGFGYELALTDAENALLQSPAPEDVGVMLILFKPEDAGNVGVSASLRAPLMINTKARIGLQKIMETMQTNVTISNLSSAV